MNPKAEFWSLHTYVLYTRKCTCIYIHMGMDSLPTHGKTGRKADRQAGSQAGRQEDRQAGRKKTGFLKITGGWVKRI